MPEALPVADEAKAKEWRNKEYHEVTSETTMLQQEARLPEQNKKHNNRGVAQLVARLLWEQDVGSSSLFTPTIIKDLVNGEI